MLLRKALIASGLSASALAQSTQIIKPSVSAVVGTDIRTDAWPSSRPWEPPMSIVGGEHLFPTVTHMIELPAGMTDCVPKDVLSSMNVGEIDIITVTEIRTSTFFVPQPTPVHPANATFTITQSFVVAGGSNISITAPLQVNDGTTFGQPQAVLTPINMDTGVSTVFLADFGDTTIPVTRPTTITHDGTAFPFALSTPAPVMFMDPAMYNTRLRLQTTVPDSCQKTEGKDKNGTQCRIDKCMEKHTRPVEINTIMVAEMLDLSAGTMVQDWFTQHTTLANPHWGVTKTNGTYWPISTMSALDRDHLPSTYAMHASHTLQCYDASSCYLSCATDAGNNSSKKRLTSIIAGAVVGGLALLIAILFCGKCFHRRIHRDTRKGPLVRRSSTDIGPSPSPEVVETTGTGTLGRRAEEGRGRVRFGQQAPGAGQVVQNAPGAGAMGQGAGATGAMGQNAGQGVGAAGEKVAQGTGRGAEKVVVTGKAAPAAMEKVVEKPAIATTQAAEHVEAVPAHDGADSNHSGSMVADTGSMRGRRRVRADGQPM